VNIEPLPGSLATVTSPPIMRASLRLDGKAQAGAPEFPRGQGVRLSELGEQLRLLLRRHADAGIGDLKPDPVATAGNLSRQELDLSAQEIEQKPGSEKGSASWR
jgi:hypothetical protein